MSMAKPGVVAVPEALAEMEKALKNNPLSADIHMNIAKLKLESGDVAGAKAEVALLRRMVPQSPYVRQISAAGL